MIFLGCTLHPKGCIYTFITAPFNVTSFLPLFCLVHGMSLLGLMTLLQIIACILFIYDACRPALIWNIKLIASNDRILIYYWTSFFLKPPILASCHWVFQLSFWPPPYCQSHRYFATDFATHLSNLTMKYLSLIN